MREAYFEVGEEVILVSEDHPEYSGETVITEKHYGKGKRRWDGMPQKSPWGYHVSAGSPNGCRWNETSLRKKHDPSSFTFEQLIKQEVPA